MAVAAEGGNHFWRGGAPDKTSFFDFYKKNCYNIFRKLKKGKKFFMRFGTELIKQTVEILKGNTTPLVIIQAMKQIAKI